MGNMFPVHLGSAPSSAQGLVVKESMSTSVPSSLVHHNKLPGCSTLFGSVTTTSGVVHCLEIDYLGCLRALQLLLFEFLRTDVRHPFDHVGCKSIAPLSERTIW